MERGGKFLKPVVDEDDNEATATQQPSSQTSSADMKYVLVEKNKALEKIRQSLRQQDRSSQ